MNIKEFYQTENIITQFLHRLKKDIQTLPPPFLAHLIVDGHSIPVHYRKSVRARRYRLWIDPFAKVQAIIPRGGSREKAQAFLIRQKSWVLKQWHNRRQWALEKERARENRLILFRGVETKIELEKNDSTSFLRIGSEVFPLNQTDPSNDSLYQCAQKVLQKSAKKELLDRTFELSLKHQLPVNRVSVRNQRSRWGSCSAKGTISLNWRLLQVPIEVRDYIILHELAHRREMNHSSRYWKVLEELCPFWKQAETWLSRHEYLLLE